MKDSTFQLPCTTSAKRCLDSSSCMCAPDAQSEQCVPTRRTSTLCFWLCWFIPLILRETMQKQFIVVLNGSKLSNHTSPWSTTDKHSMPIIFKALILFTQTFTKNGWSASWNAVLAFNAKTFRPLQQFLKRLGCYLKNSHTPVTQWSETLWHCGILKSTAFTATAFHAYLY